MVSWLHVTENMREQSMALTLAISIQLAHHDIGWMANNRAEDTRDIPTQETDTSLAQLAVALLGLAHSLVDHFNRLLKGSKLGHSVRDLARPQGIQALVETAKPLLRDNATPALTQIVGEGRESRLHAHFDGFHRAQGHIGKELGGCTSAQEDEGAVGAGEQLVSV